MTILTNRDLVVVIEPEGEEVTYEGITRMLPIRADISHTHSRAIS